MWLRKSCAFVLFCSGVASAVAAQNFPSKAIAIVTGYQVGGTNDTIARLVANKMSASLGVPVVVENKIGAAGNIAARHVAQAAPDGYVIAAVPVGNLAINQWIFSNTGFDPEK